MLSFLQKQTLKNVRTWSNVFKLRVLSTNKFSSNFEQSNFFENYKSPFLPTQKHMDELIDTAVKYIKTDLYDKKPNQCPTGIVIINF